IPTFFSCPPSAAADRHTIITVGQATFFTWRLHGSLPQSRSFPSAIVSGRAFLARDRVLDTACSGPLFLRMPEIAKMVMAAMQAPCEEGSLADSNDSVAVGGCGRWARKECGYLAERFSQTSAGRLPIGRRLPTCPTSYATGSENVETPGTDAFVCQPHPTRPLVLSDYCLTPKWNAILAPIVSRFFEEGFRNAV